MDAKLTRVDCDGQFLYVNWSRLSSPVIQSDTHLDVAMKVIL